MVIEMGRKFWDYIERHLAGLMMVGAVIIALVTVIVWGAVKGAFSFVVIGGILLASSVVFFV